MAQPLKFALMPILNYTTQVSSENTIAQINKILVAHGAFKITTDYNDQKMAVGVTFCIVLQNRPVAFALPCNYTGVLKAMKNDRKVPGRLCTDEQALRVSWRILKDWVEAQMAIVEAGLAELPEVFLPYAVTADGATLYKRIIKDGQRTPYFLSNG